MSANLLSALYSFIQEYGTVKTAKMLNNLYNQGFVTYEQAVEGFAYISEHYDGSNGIILK